ncbi:hypothetical protein CDIFMA2_33410 [Clostridioides difficile]|uniref:DUF3139 domain-containing protein n=1 Tax=Clostridioides sp. ZZV14-6153 TaxID=2811494 RepID=UPI0039BC6B46|nr:hypothetical protein CDIFMA2_33410 [Clostridioides difficile]
MSKIVFFSIPAYVHTNPTVEVVRELVDRGDEVLYYSFNEFKDKIEGAGAKFICCDKYLPELHPGDEKKIGKDFSGLIEMIVDTTISFLLVLIISIVGITGSVVYNNYFKPWKDAEIYINKYMVKQDISEDNIKSITKEKAKKASYKGILYRVYYKDDPQYEY